VSRIIGRLPFLKRDRPRPGDVAEPADAADPSEEADDPGPPPVLRPAAIFRQLLWDPAEASPIWARPRPVPAAIEPASAPTTAPGMTATAPDPSDAVTPDANPAKPARRPRRAKAESSAAAPSAKPKRPTRKKPGALER
jgi:hypothetical protein